MQATTKKIDGTISINNINFIFYLTIYSLQSIDLPVHPNSATEMIRNHSSSQDRLVYDPLDMLGLDTTVPDALSGQRIRARGYRR